MRKIIYPLGLLIYYLVYLDYIILIPLTFAVIALIMYQIIKIDVRSKPKYLRKAHAKIWLENKLIIAIQVVNLIAFVLTMFYIAYKLLPYIIGIGNV